MKFVPKYHIDFYDVLSLIVWLYVFNLHELFTGVYAITANGTSAINEESHTNYILGNAVIATANETSYITRDSDTKDILEDADLVKANDTSPTTRESYTNYNLRDGVVATANDTFPSPKSRTKYNLQNGVVATTNDTSSTTWESHAKYVLDHDNKGTANHTSLTTQKSRTKYILQNAKVHANKSTTRVSKRKYSPGLRKSHIKYILRWSNHPNSPFFSSIGGTQIFVRNKCKHTNCFVTNYLKYFPCESIQYFDAVVFNGRTMNDIMLDDIPGHRSPYQKYIFAMMEPSTRYPILNNSLDGFFNWTWTYKTSSDIRWSYITIYDINGTVVGPKTDMHWIKHMDPINNELKRKLSRKNRAAASFASNCHTQSGRGNFCREIQSELKKYGWNVDIYEECGTLTCPKREKELCEKKVEDNYYFYFAFENSLAEDYVTEKLLIALDNYAVPVVFGGANYSRFLPEGSYLDGRKLGAKDLAKKIDEIITDNFKYFDFFRWRNHYVYKRTGEAGICNLCAMLNDNKSVMESVVWNNFRAWWNDGAEKQCTITDTSLIRRRKNTKLDSLSFGSSVLPISCADKETPIRLYLFIVYLFILF